MANWCILLFSWVSIVTSIGNVRSSKILMVPGKGSHYSLATALGEELNIRGHLVTILLPDIYENRVNDPFHAKLFSFIIYNYPIPIADDGLVNQELSTAAFLGTSKLGAFHKMTATRIKYCEEFSDKAVLKQLSEEGFDMVISDPSIRLPCDDGLGRYLGVPRGYIMTGSLFPAFLRHTGIRVNRATTAEIGLGFPSRMNFAQRVVNVMASVVVGSYLTLFSGDRHWQEGTTELDSPVHLVDFVIMPLDPVIGRVTPLPPGYIMAAGLTTGPTKPLEERLENFMQSSGEHGVIIFSTGNAATHLPEKLVEAFRDGFSKVPQKVIWQWKSEAPLKDVPGNVMTMDWLPQNDLLGHSKTRLLMYQGGNNGLFEAIYHGVPLIVMPMNFDQPDIAQSVVEKGVGVRIRFSEVTGESLSQLINEVLTDKTYQTNMTRMSAIFRDRHHTPREKAATFVEHVLKHGADHLRTPDRGWPFVQFYLIDVIGFLILCVVLIILIAFITLKYTMRLIRCFAALRKDKRD